MRAGKWQYRNKGEAGVSLSGLILVLVVLGAIALVAVKVMPAYIEYHAIKDAIVKAKTAGDSVSEVRKSFERSAEINDITAIRSKDLVISRETGQTEVAFDYEKRIPLAGNVSLLIDFAASTDPSGVVTGKADAPAK